MGSCIFAVAPLKREISRMLKHMTVMQKNSDCFFFFQCESFLLLEISLFNIFLLCILVKEIQCSKNHLCFNTRNVIRRNVKSSDFSDVLWEVNHCMPGNVINSCVLQPHISPAYSLSLQPDPFSPLNCLKITPLGSQGVIYPLPSSFPTSMFIAITHDPSDLFSPFKSLLWLVFL